MEADSNMEFSIIIKGCRLCSNACHYCSAPTVLPNQEVNFKNEKHEIDYDKMRETMLSNPILKDMREKKEPIQINLWGGNPLDHLDEMDALMDWFMEDMKEFWQYDEKSVPHFYISTGGAPLRRKKVRDWVDKHVADPKRKLEIQLSHDGIGNFIRDPNYDPLYDKDVGPWLVELVKKGCLTMINATLHRYNNSHYANIFYWNKWRYENHIENIPMMIKNNHMNDSEYCMDFNLRGPELSEYFHELEMVWQQAFLADENDPWWQPYRGYYLNQMTRWEMYGGPGGCGLFSTGARDYTWCMNTMGEYVMCQLWDTNEGMPNPELKRPLVYQENKYRNYNEMFPCPDMDMSLDPSYKVEYIRCVLRMKHFIHIVTELKKRGEVPTPPDKQRRIGTYDISNRIPEY